MSSPKITVLSATMRGTKFELTTDTYSLGRSEDRDICIPDSSMSSNHCQLTRRPSGDYEAMDNGSTNGTRINGIALTTPTELNPGDILQCGGIELLYDSEKEVATMNSTSTGIDLDLSTGEYNLGELGNISDVGSNAPKSKGMLWTAIIGILAILVLGLLATVFFKFT